MPLALTPNTICVLRLSALGDVCNATAAVQAIQRRWPQSKITWICGKLEAQFLQLIPNIEVIPFDKKGGKKAKQALKQALKGRKFDYLLHMQSAIRASMLSLSIPATVRLGFDRQRAKDLQWLFSNKKIAAAPKPHVLDGFMQFAAYLQCEDLTPQWHINIPEEAVQWAQQQLPDNALLICPGASKAYKNWTVQGYVELIQYAQQKGLEPLLIGGPSNIELTLANEICAQLLSPIINLVGKTSLPQLTALIKQAPLLISPDTGPAHLAVALNTPVIGLYAHHNPQRTGPYLWQQYVVSVYEEAILAQTGKPVSQQNWRQRVKDNAAMQRIDAQRVIAKLNTVLNDLGLYQSA